MSVRRRLIPVIAAFSLAVMAAPVAAHTDETGTSPKDGASLKKAPSSVSATFAEDILSKGAQLVARDDTGAKVALGSVSVDGDTVSADWPADAVAGRFIVSYRVTASDGHPLRGNYKFTITGSEPRETDVTPNAAPEGAQAAEPTPVVAEPDPSPAASTNEPAGPSPLLALAGLAAIVTVGAGFFVARRK